MTTSADEPTRPTVPSGDMPTLKPGDRSPDADATRATAPARSGMSDTRATVPAQVSGSAPTQVAGPGGLSATAATALHVEGAPRQPGATGSHEGEQWGDFHVGRLLGRGGMGAVYAGRQVSLDRPVAIKVLIGHLAENEDFRKRFLLEARAAARINSPHVVQVYFAGTHGAMDFFAMEYVEGTDLARKLKDGWRPTPPECLELIIQATRSLVALGEHNIVHRDIKPANYMLTTAGMVKLMDFGLVKFASEAHGLTQTGTIMGTVNYFSPEQGRGEVCDQRTDLYALGVMFYEMLTGKLPFTGGDATSVIYQHIHAEPKPPKLHNPSVTEPYQSVVLKCLEKDAKDRYQTAKELLEDLERISRGEKPLLRGRTPRAATGSSSAPTASRKLTLAAAVVIAAVILGLALLLRPTASSVVVATNDPTVAPGGQPVVAPQAITPPPVTLPAATPPPATPPPATPPPAVAPTPVVTAVVPPAPVVSVPAVAPTAVAQTTPPVATPTVTAPATPTPPPVAPATAPTPVVATAPTPVVTAPTPVVTAPTPAPAVVETPVPVPVVVEAPAKPPQPPPATTPVVVEAPVKPATPPTVAPPVVSKPPPRPATAPAQPAAPAGIRTPVQSTVRIPIPAGDPLLGAATWLWWLEGPNGRSGRLSARSTRRPEIEWTAPAQPGNVTLHVAAVGSQRRLSLPLIATAAPADAGGTLAPFLRANFVDERHVQRLHRDLDGSWWLVDADEAAISRNADGWLSGGRFAPMPAPSRPVTVASSPTAIAVLDTSPAALLLYGRNSGRDGAPGISIPGFQRPSDVVALGDGLWAVADLRSGGVVVVDEKGQRRRLHQRTGTGGWDLLTRLASDGRTLYALDSGTPALVLFGQEPQPLATWPLDRAMRPVAVAVHQGRVFVLGNDGGIRVLDAKGQVTETLPSAAAALPDESLGVPSDLVIDSTGDLYVTYPDREMIARHSTDGKQFAIRHARTWTWKAYAADGANRLYAIDSGQSRVVVLDAEGWRQGVIGKTLSKGGTFESPSALAVHPDGAALAVLDEDTRQITRFDLRSGAHLVFGGRGKNDGQFDSPMAVAMDQDGRTYVLDIGMHRVSLFDAQGVFQRHIGRYERGDAPDMLRAPRLLTVSVDGGLLFVYDEESMLVKRFAIDHASNQVRHVGNFGGRGTGPGQFSRITGMGCDRRGRLYCLDYKRADLQVFDVTGETPALLTVVRGDQHGIRRMLNLALTPDGIPLIIGGDQLTGLRWMP